METLTKEEVFLIVCSCELARDNMNVIIEEHISGSKEHPACVIDTMIDVVLELDEVIPKLRRLA